METRVDKIARFLEETTHIRERLVKGQVNKEEYADILRFLLMNQKDDGAWTLLEDYRVDSDIRVAYVYEPTYNCCCALIYLDNVLNFHNNSVEAKALEKGLKFATGRGLSGHGYEATSVRMQVMEH